jgi:hypothetical protein
MFSGWRSSFPGIKQPGSEVSHTTPSAEVNNVWALPLLCRYVFMACTKTTLSCTVSWTFSHIEWSSCENTVGSRSRRWGHGCIWKLLNVGRRTTDCNK